LRNLIDQRTGQLVERLLPARDLADGHREALTVCFVDIGGYTALAALAALRQRYVRGAGALEIEALSLRAGMHHGEVVVSRDGDLFGADVNLAARLQGAAGEGELPGSETALAGLGDWSRERRELRLKNVPLAVSAGVMDW